MLVVAVLGLQGGNVRDMRECLSVFLCVVGAWSVKIVERACE